MHRFYYHRCGSSPRQYPTHTERWAKIVSLLDDPYQFGQVLYLKEQDRNHPEWGARAAVGQNRTCQNLGGNV